MYTISREYHWSSAHMITDHPKCGRLHGHNYRMEVEVTKTMEPSETMVLDFADLDKVIKPLVDAMDHRFISSLGNLCGEGDFTSFLYKRNPDWVFTINEMESTAELLAKHFVECIERNLPSEVRVVEVRIWETPKSMAKYA